jgi:hypothetical protein
MKQYLLAGTSALALLVGAAGADATLKVPCLVEAPEAALETSLMENRCFWCLA